MRYVSLALCLVLAGCACGANPAQTAGVCEPVALAAEAPCAPLAATPACAPCAAAPQTMQVALASIDPCARAALAQGGSVMVLRSKVDGATYVRAGLSFPPKVAACVVDGAGKVVVVAVDTVRCVLQGLIDWLNPPPTVTLVAVPAPRAAAPCAPAPTATPCAPR